MNLEELEHSPEDLRALHHDPRPDVLRAMGWRQGSFTHNMNVWYDGHGNPSVNLCHWHPDRFRDDVAEVVTWICKDSLRREKLAHALWEVCKRKNWGPGNFGQLDLEDLLLSGVRLTPDRIWQACRRVLGEAKLIGGDA